jgi:thiol-disulfide isomerase/thioredoxin
MTMRISRLATRVRLLFALVLLVAALFGTTAVWAKGIPDLPPELHQNTGDKMILVDFYTEFCGTCQMMTPHLQALEKKTRDRIAFKHVDIGTKSGSKYLDLYHIGGTPTYILFNPDGKAVYRMQNLISPTVLEKQVLRSLHRLDTVKLPQGTPLPEALAKPPGEFGDMVLLFLETKHCNACDEMQPYISGFEMTAKPTLHVVHLDADSPEGKQIMEKFAIKNLPGYLLLDNTAADAPSHDTTLSRGELFRAYGQIQPRLLWDIIRIFGQTGV